MTLTTKMYYRIQTILLSSVFAAAILTGCGGDGAPELVSDVTGQVILKGQPVPDAVVVFEPKQGRPSTGLTDADGKFSLTYSESHSGAVPGEHLVRISKMDGEAGAELIPNKYNMNSTLTETVSTSTENSFTFDLK